MIPIGMPMCLVTSRNHKEVKKIVPSISHSISDVDLFGPFRLRDVSNLGISDPLSLFEVPADSYAR
ncbi:hypothetical protein BDDG_12204 [Blastomyces dermatitidis ATCC 18188]|uniref:Uncharacterized protein n=1 Tax=Ajellomyces dermatitidis (strain ATCC 18188 / CBS 674.68) TaxID=653446 RepID=A0A0J9EMS6_AJEDA|nr:hypothetical protein BDDG_12204 [Blastomyces dermatitidis ATCC 18188]